MNNHKEMLSKYWFSVLQLFNKNSHHDIFFILFSCRKIIFLTDFHSDYFFVGVTESKVKCSTISVWKIIYTQPFLRNYHKFSITQTTLTMNNRTYLCCFKLAYIDSLQFGNMEIQPLLSIFQRALTSIYL